MPTALAICNLQSTMLALVYQTTRRGSYQLTVILMFKIMRTSVAHSLYSADIQFSPEEINVNLTGI